MILEQFRITFCDDFFFPEEGKKKRGRSDEGDGKTRRGRERERIGGRNFGKGVRKRTRMVNVDESKPVDFRSGKITDRDEPSK